MGDNAIRVWSIGHSTHALDAFLALLARHEIATVADIRTLPKSRRHPHFHREELARTLPAQGLEYVHLGALGGWRSPRADSPNGAWRNASFRGYADYALGPEFASGLAALYALAQSGPTAMMCSEGLWWRCHRRLVCDRVVADGHVAVHIAPDGGTSLHELTPFASVGSDGALRYPAVG